MTESRSKQLSLLGVAMLMYSLGYTQSVAPQSVNSSGTKMTHANGSVSFTVGELVVLSPSGSLGNTLGSGFTAGVTLTTVSVQEPDTSVFNVTVYPNPTTALLNIRIKHTIYDKIEVTITDLQGKKVYNSKYAGAHNVIEINTASYATGTYILTLLNPDNQVLGTYKLIKH